MAAATYRLHLDRVSVHLLPLVFIWAKRFELLTTNTNQKTCKKQPEKHIKNNCFVYRQKLRAIYLRNANKEIKQLNHQVINQVNKKCKKEEKKDKFNIAVTFTETLFPYRPRVGLIPWDPPPPPGCPRWDSNPDSQILKPEALLTELSGGPWLVLL